MPASKKLQQWYWTPIAVFMIGMLSIILLLWVDRINERLHIDADIVDAIMDVQIHAAKAHLWVEHIMLGGTDGDANSFTAELDQAIKLVDVTLSGGVAEHDRIPEPLQDPELRARAEAIKSLLKQLKINGLIRLQSPGQSGLGSDHHHQFDAVFNEILIRARGLEDIMETDEARNEEKSRLLFLGILVIWAALVAVAAMVLQRREKQRKDAAERLLKANDQLLSQAEELTEHRERLAEQVESRTAELIAANERVKVEMVERLQTCEALNKTERQIQHLSGKLLRAQEVERKRISMELHDELGQDLNVMKLQIRVVERGLNADQEAIREDCEKLLEYIDQVIEEVRRLSLDLSPTVLEDLGLTAALRWLISNLGKIPDMSITADVAEIDHLYSANNWITIYRIIQEALTNVAKHARAENVSVVIRPHDHRVVFSIEDDGEGFDPDQVMRKDAFEKGFGLTTLNERVGIMGGTLDLWSRKGEGTRITFNIPIENRGV
jgi:signal transduction histidine kinase